MSNILKDSHFQIRFKFVCRVAELFFLLAGYTLLFLAGWKIAVGVLCLNAARAYHDYLKEQEKKQ